MRKFISTPAGQVTIIAGVAYIAYRFAQKQAAEAIQAVNPTNSENIFYQGVNGVGESVTGRPFDLGHWLYDVFN